MNYKADKPCVCCNQAGENKITFHHVKSRGSGGTDDSWNLMPICLTHHNETHSKGNSWMVSQYYGFKKWLLDNGWEYDPMFKKWRRS